MRINLHELLLENRYEAVEEGYASFGERMAWKVWKKVSMSRKLMNTGSSKMRSWMINTFVKDWTRHRGEMQFPEKSFNQLWRERNGQ
jgi:L-lactate dehydrogenase complex protein LldF